MSLIEDIRAEEARRGDWYGGTVDAIVAFLGERDGLTFAEFDRRAVPVKTPDGPLLLWATGLGEEAAETIEAAFGFVVATGRVQGIAKKIERDGDGQDTGRAVTLAGRDAALLKEAGDVLFYLNQVLKRRGLTLEGSARALLAKLEGMRP